MRAFLDALIRTFCCQNVTLEPARQGKWIIDLPPIGNIRLGPFRTKEEALDYRREYIIRKLQETNTAEELPF